MGLSERDAAILELERTAWALPGRKEALVRERLGLSPTTYYKLLAALLDDPDRRAALGEAGHERSLEFTWQASAEAHMAAFRRALEP